uniref:DUF538 domain-containing protein n=1 Tax=Rhizophora mucronata TaxID=61149 RepID=A0A2P2KGE2_RHIMU
MALFSIKTCTSLSTILCVVLMFSQSFTSFALDQEDISHHVEKPTAYEMLGKYEFPVGILPKGVLGYDLDNTTSKFSAFMNGTCSFSLEGSYQLKYKATIKGHISKGKILSLEGVSVKLFFMWVDIIEVSRSGNDLEFSVGIAGAGFPVDNFEESPQCGCGLNCGDDRKLTWHRKNSFVSSS